MTTATKKIIALDAVPPPANKISFFERRQTELEQEGFEVSILPNTGIKHESRDVIDEELARSKELLQRAGGLVVACYNVGYVLMGPSLSVRTHMHQAAEADLPIFLHGSMGADQNTMQCFRLSNSELLPRLNCVGESMSRIRNLIGE